MLSAVRMLIGSIPVSFGIGGRVNARAIATLDPIFSRMRTARIKTARGVIELNMRHEPQRFMAYCYYNLRRYYANSPLGRYIRQLTPGSTFVDVGANLGFYSLLAREAGLEAMCFEPEPELANYLERNRHAFGQIFPVALSDEDGSLPLYYFPRNWGATSLVPTKWSWPSESTVPVKTFSSVALLGELGDPAKIALVKIDVEGAEAATVGGMTDFLAAGYRPDIWCEVRGNDTDRGQGSFAQVRDRLRRFGYSMFDVPEATEPQPAPDEQILMSRGIFDALFRAEPTDSAIEVQPPKLAQVP
jgi:FkbM family methyltransferase